MEAPEKIYLHPDLDSIFGITERYCESEIEYIRADVFIEKACAAYCKVCKMPNCRRSNECKWLSDFKEYLSIM